MLFEYTSKAEPLLIHYQKAKGKEKKHIENAAQSLYGAYTQTRDSAQNIREMSSREYHGDWSKELSKLNSFLESECSKLEQIIQSTPSTFKVEGGGKK